MTSGHDDKIIHFPLDAGERKALRKQKQEREQQRLIRCFVDKTGNTQGIIS
jgi:hypothetical protein